MKAKKIVEIAGWVEPAKSSNFGFYAGYRFSTHCTLFNEKPLR
jgi:hypothetical protein